MTAAGWVLMACSWLTIGSVVAFCLYRISRQPNLEPPDSDDAGQT